jgi:hypothetical protein
MHRTLTKPRSTTRPALAVGVALAAAALMIVTAWFKRSAPAGSVTREALDGLGGVLMIVALLVPYLAVPLLPTLPLRGATKVRGGHEQ